MLSNHAAVRFCLEFALMMSWQRIKARNDYIPYYIALDFMLHEQCACDDCWAMNIVIVMSVSK